MGAIPSLVFGDQLLTTLLWLPAGKRRDRWCAGMWWAACSVWYLQVCACVHVWDEHVHLLSGIEKWKDNEIMKHKKS